MRLETVLGSKNRVRVLRALYTRDGGSGRQVARAAKLSASAANVALGELVEAGFLLRSGTPGKHAFELNREHLLSEVVGRLFAEEATLETRLVEMARRHARDLRRELLGVGIDTDGGVTLALRPAVDFDSGLMAPLRTALRGELGLALSTIVETPPGPDFSGKWIKTIETPTRRPSEGVGRDEALRFFGLARRKPE